MIAPYPVTHGTPNDRSEIRALQATAGSARPTATYEHAAAPICAAPTANPGPPCPERARPRQAGKERGASGSSNRSVHSVRPHGSRRRLALRVNYSRIISGSDSRRDTRRYPPKRFFGLSTRHSAHNDRPGQLLIGWPVERAKPTIARAQPRLYGRSRARITTPGGHTRPTRESPAARRIQEDRRSTLANRLRGSIRSEGSPPCQGTWARRRRGGTHGPRIHGRSS
jgi:hypothetical protein